MSSKKHQSTVSQSIDWLTPPEWLDRLGAFDLDPCASVGQPWATARVMYTIHDDGLAQPWTGRVWLNPPFGRAATQWLERLAAHGDGIALLPAATETALWYRHVWPKASAVLFAHGRPRFRLPVTGEAAAHNSGCDIALIAYGATNRAALIGCDLGVVVTVEYLPERHARRVARIPLPVTTSGDSQPRPSAPVGGEGKGAPRRRGRS